MAQTPPIRFGPFRPVKDFIANADDYGMPVMDDLPRWNNRVTNNLLYYQTNYILVIMVFFVIIGTLHTAQFMIGLLTVSIIFAGFVFLTNSSAEMQRLKQNKPYMNAVIVILSSCLVLKTFGSLLVFSFSICMPLTLILIHASLRLRNLKNKLTNKSETIGLIRTPMGVLLELLGAANEIAS